MGVEGGGAGGTVFLVRQDFRKLDLFPVPGRAIHVKHLGHRTPANIFDQQSFFVRGSRTIFGIKRPQDFDGLEILGKFLLGSAFTEPVIVGDAITVKILWRVVGLVAVG
jgi:hypothetical protein